VAIPGGLEYNRVTVSYAETSLDRDFKGKVLNGLIGLGRKIAVSDSINGLFLGLYDPSFNADRRLHKSAFLLRLGLEIR
jgi:hypothetical protein